MKWSRIFLMIALPIILAGCVPELLYHWSPDGKWMTVLNDHEGLRIADADGNLLPGKIDSIGNVAWYGNDSQRLLAVRAIQAKQWEEVISYSTPRQIQAIQEAAARARQFALTYDWTAPNASDWDKFSAALVAQEKAAGRPAQIYAALGGAIGIFLRENADDSLRRAIPDARWKELADLTQTVFSIDIYDINPAALNESNREATLMKSLTPPGELRTSPTSKAFLVVTARIDDGPFDQLWLVPNDGTHGPMLLAEQAAQFPDWSPDGNDVVFVAPNEPERSGSGTDPTLGTVNRLNVVGKDGNFLDKPPAVEPLAGLICNEETRVRCLADGRIVFSSADVTLPATANDMPSEQELFAIEPGKLATVQRLLPRQTARQMADSAQYFEISPDGKLASIPNSDGKVDVVDLAGAEITHVQDKPISLNNGDHKEDTLPCEPTWRNSDELTFAAPGDADHWTVSLWSRSKNAGKTLSAAWPPAMVSNAPTTQP